MTEKKRFVNVGKYILQNGEWYCSAYGEHCADVIATALNMLFDENEQLKSELGEKDIQLDFLKSENNHMSNLVNENEQLKSELKALLKKYNDFYTMVFEIWWSND